MRVGLYGRSTHDAMAAFAQGASAAGHQVTFRRVGVFTPDQVEDFDVVVITGVWSHLTTAPRVCQQVYQERGTPTLVFDAGHVRRKDYVRFGVNTLYAIPPAPLPRDRFDRLAFDPIRPLGDQVLICQDLPLGLPKGQPASIHAKWAWEVCDKLKDLTDRVVRYRPHPWTVVSGPLPGDEVSDSRQESMDDAMGKAAVVIVRWGGCGTEAILRGVPVICDPGAFYEEYAEVDLSRVDDPALLPEAKRVEFGSRLAYTQWTLPELTERQNAETILQQALAA